MATRHGSRASTLDAFENGRIGELGFPKIARILSVLGMETKLLDASQDS